MEALQPSLDEVDKDISDAEYALSSVSRSDPLFSVRIPSLGLSQLRRYMLSHDQQDRDKSLIYLTHSIFLPFYTLRMDGPHPITLFFLLSRVLLDRSFELKQLSGVEYCVKYFHFFRDRSFEAFGIEYDHVTMLLVRALSLQAQWNSECGVQDLEKISALCSELLASNVKESLLNDAIPALAHTTASFVSTTQWIEPSPQIIECLREAKRRLPHSRIVSIALSMSLFTRANSTTSHSDYEDAMASLDGTIAFHSAADIPGEDMRSIFGQVKLLSFCQYAMINGKPEYAEEAIFRSRTLLSQIPFDDPLRATAVQNITMLEDMRFREFGIVHDRQEAHSDDPGVIDISDLVVSLAKSNAGKHTSEELCRHHRAVQALTMDHLTHMSLADIQEAIEYCRLLLASLQSSPNEKLTFMITLDLGSFFRHVFKLTHIADYLNESIAIFRAIKTTRAARLGSWRSFFVLELISSLEERFMLSCDKRDLDEIIQLYPLIVTDSHTRLTIRFMASYEWASIVHRRKHPSTSIAYETAISLMHESLTLAPTLEIQHARLVSMRNTYQKLPLNFASYQVDIGQIENAIETLERGRALLWSEMRGLRTSTDQLRIVNSSLAERIATINRDLEALTTSTSPGPWTASERSRAEGLDGMEPIGRLVVKQRNLVEERKSVILQIQALPGFDWFLMVPSFDTLRSAAVHGPVIIINHSEFQSDIIIFLQGHPPSRIPMAADFYSRANRMTDEVISARNRKNGLESKEYENTLSSVLAELYDLIGQQVIERFHLLNVPEQSRVWWCPTSVLCSLPLHAMGPIRTDGSDKLYFSDLYIPSYTPTLSALIEARRYGAESLQRPPVLLVTQPDAKMPNALQEMRVVQAIAKSVTSLTWDTATPSTTLEHLRDHRFLHILCHGDLERGRPFNAFFKLNQGTRLTLLEIVRSQLPTAEFAFLSACHTAEITEESIADEVLHLAAAVQYCGFRSVVGTMWAMADIDGPDLVGHFYRSVFSSDSRWEGVPHHKRTAEALRDAVKRLRRKRNITLERWVNFVHYGA